MTCSFGGKHAHFYAQLKNAVTHFIFFKSGVYPKITGVDADKLDTLLLRGKGSAFGYWDEQESFWRQQKLKNFQQNYSSNWILASDKKRCQKKELVTLLFQKEKNKKGE